MFNDIIYTGQFAAEYRNELNICKDESIAKLLK